MNWGQMNWGTEVYVLDIRPYFIACRIQATNPRPDAGIALTNPSDALGLAAMYTETGCQGWQPDCPLSPDGELGRVPSNLKLSDLQALVQRRILISLGRHRPGGMAGRTKKGTEVEYKNLRPQ